MATTTIYWGVTNNTLYLSSSATSQAPTSFNADNTSNSSTYWPWTDSKATLTNIIIQNNIEFNATNLACMFQDCTSLTSLDLSNFNTSNVTRMGNMFRNCSSLTSLSISNFNTSSVVSMNSMFRDCSSLTSLNISNFNTSNVTSMSYMFYNCKALTSLNISNFNTSNVTSMSYMFYYCEDLTSLDISNFNTSNVTNMSYMFRQCSSLTSLDISSFNTSSVTSMSYMFYNCTNLEKIIVSTLWDASAVTTSTAMLGNCKKIEGQNGTTYNSSIIDKTYAKVDESNSPGYFWLRIYPKILLDAYHYTAADTNGRTDACKLVLDSNKEGESSSVPNDGAIWIPPTTGTLSVNYGGATYRTGSDSFTMNSNSLGGSTSIPPIVGTYSDFSDADIISIVDCPSGWSTNSPMTIEQIRNTTEADFEALPTPRIGFYYDPSRSTDYAKYRCEYRWASGEADGETYTYTIKMNDPDLTRHTLHLKGFHEFDFNYTEYPEVIIGPKTLVLNNTGYSLTERSGSSLGEEDYSLSVPERWSWYESGTHEVWIEYAAGEDGDNGARIIQPVEGAVTAELFYNGSSLGISSLEPFVEIPFELGTTEGYIIYLDLSFIFVHLITPAEYPLSFKVVYTNP